MLVALIIGTGLFLSLTVLLLSCCCVAARADRVMRQMFIAGDDARGGRNQRNGQSLLRTTVCSASRESLPRNATEVRCV